MLSAVGTETNENDSKKIRATVMKRVNPYRRLDCSNNTTYYSLINAISELNTI